MTRMRCTNSQRNLRKSFAITVFAKNAALLYSIRKIFTVWRQICIRFCRKRIFGNWLSFRNICRNIWKQTASCLPIIDRMIFKFTPQQFLNDFHSKKIKEDFSDIRLKMSAQNGKFSLPAVGTYRIIISWKHFFYYRFADCCGCCWDCSAPPFGYWLQQSLRPLTGCHLPYLGCGK